MLSTSYFVETKNYQVAGGKLVIGFGVTNRFSLGNLIQVVYLRNDRNTRIKTVVSLFMIVTLCLS